LYKALPIGSCPVTLNVCVAPKRTANSSLGALVSTATVIAAPAIAQPWIALRPTPLHPNTTATAPASTLAVLTAVAEASHDAASDQSGPVERHLPVDLHEVVGVQGRVLGHDAQPQNTLSGAPAASKVRTLPPGKV
jgi:hypothetical protein